MYRSCPKLRDVRDASFVRWVDEEAGKDVEFVVQEKVCGEPVWMGCDGQDVALGWLSELNDDGAKVEVLSAGLAGLAERYRPRLFRLCAHVRQLFPDVRSVKVYGELFGGEYPHCLVARCKERLPVREGVYYAPDYGFYAYDIGVEGRTFGEGKRSCEQECEDAAALPHYLSVAVCNRLFESLGIFHARTLFQGSLEECLHYPNAFPTRLPDWLDLPPLRNNWCEGTVIRPLAPLLTTAGERVLLKNVNSRHKSSVGLGHHVDPSAHSLPCTRGEASPVSAECADMLTELRALFSPELLSRVRKEMGRPSSAKHSASVASRLRREVLEQFFQLNLNRFDALPARERQHITRALCQLSDRLAREVP